MKQEINSLSNLEENLKLESYRSKNKELSTINLWRNWPNLNGGSIKNKILIIIIYENKYSFLHFLAKNNPQTYVNNIYN
mgnify:CR=1 FL=1